MTPAYVTRVSPELARALGPSPAAAERTNALCRRLGMAELFPARGIVHSGERCWSVRVDGLLVAWVTGEERDAIAYLETIDTIDAGAALASEVG